MPVIYVPHGGGPWPWTETNGVASDREKRALIDYLTGLVRTLPRRPKAMVVVSAHWEEPVPTVTTSPTPPLYYDYGGFPPEMYEIPWPAPGQPDLAAHVRALLGGAGLPSAGDAERGFDHGTFVPLKLAVPDADIPTVQLSLQDGLDPARHLAIGHALVPLRSEDVLLVGSGMSFHNVKCIEGRIPRCQKTARSEAFDVWLQHAVLDEPAARDRRLVRWTDAPTARVAHPREEHLLPLMVVAGAAGEDTAEIAFHDTFGGVYVSAFRFGEREERATPGWGGPDWITD